MRHVVALTVLVAATWITVAATYSTFGHTWDEPEHLAAGIAWLDTGRYPYDVQHPPLARLAIAFGPYLAGAHARGNPGPSGEEEGRDILYDDGQYDLYLTLARIGILPFLAALLITTWVWSRRFHGSAESWLATLWVATTPVILGHSGVAALDIPMVGTTLPALYLLLRWFERVSLRAAVTFGVAAGIAAATKLSAIPFIGVTALVWGSAWLATGPHPFGSIGKHALVATGTAFFVLTLFYGFDLALLRASFSALIEHNHDGHLSYFMGELRRSGWWNFYLVALALKTPLPLLIGALAGSAWLLRRAYREKNWMPAAPVLAFAAILTFASAFSAINIGVRHVLILYPLMAIVAAAGLVALWRQFAQPAARTLIVALLAWQGIGLVLAHPDHLAHFNELAGRHPERFLVDSDLDWGQDLKRLKAELKRRQINHCHFVYRGSADLKREGLTCTLLEPHQPTTGWIAVSLLAKQTGSEDGGYEWLDAYTPVTRVGKSIDLYFIETRDTGHETGQN